MKLTRRQALHEWKKDDTECCRRDSDRGFPPFDCIESDEDGAFCYAVIERDCCTVALFRPRGDGDKEIMGKAAKELAKEMSIRYYMIHGKED